MSADVHRDRAKDVIRPLLWGGRVAVFAGNGRSVLVAPTANDSVAVTFERPAGLPGGRGATITFDLNDLELRAFVHALLDVAVGVFDGADLWPEVCLPRLGPCVALAPAPGGMWKPATVRDGSVCNRVAPMSVDRLVAGGLSDLLATVAQDGGESGARA